MTTFTQFNNASNDPLWPKLWLRKLFIYSSHFTKRVEPVLLAEFVPCKDNPDGSKTVKMNLEEGDIKTVIVKNLFTEAANDEEFALAIEGVFAALKKVGIEKGIMNE